MIRLIASLLCFVPIFCFAQSWVEKMNDNTVNFYNVQQDFNQYWGNRPYKRGYGWKQFRRWEHFWEQRVQPSGQRPVPKHTWQTYYDYQRAFPNDTEESKRFSNWQPLGPTDWVSYSYNPGVGRVNAVAEHPTDPNTIYVGSPSGGAWKSTDGGSSWTCITDELPGAGVSTIAIDTANPNVIYIGTGDDDANDTYSIGIYKSINGGQTWSEVTPQSASIFGTSIRQILISPANNTHIFAAGSSGCYKSEDSGATWTLLRNGSFRDMELKPGDPNTIYLSSKNMIYSTDGGQSWSTSTGLPSTQGTNRAEIAVSPDNPDYVYFLCGKQSNSSFRGLYRSIDGGQSFTLQANSPNLFAYDESGSDLDAGQSWYDMALCVNPSDAEDVFIGGINVWRSVDGGLNFTLLSHWYFPPGVAYVHADVHTLQFFGNHLYCCSDGGVFKSTNNGASFSDLSAGLNISQFYKIDVDQNLPDRVIGGTQDNGTNIIINGRSNHIRGADGMQALFAPADTNIMYMSSQYGGFRRSNNGGFNSVPIFPDHRGNGAWVTPLVMNPNMNDMLLAGFNQVVMSLDQGTTGIELSAFASNDLLRSLAISPSHSFTHFYAASYTDFYITQDGGQTWLLKDNGLPNNSITSITPHPDNPDEIYLTFSGYLDGEKLYVTYDAGDSWTNISGNIPNVPVNCLAFQKNSDNAMYIGTDIGVFYKDSINHTWQLFNNGLPVVVINDLKINYTSQELVAGTYGRGIWSSPLKPRLATRPVADFSISSIISCNTDSVQFTDASLDNTAGWQWSFPGGSPSTSTDPSPKVMYNTAGTYQVTLIVSNPLGQDTITKPVAIDFKPNSVTFDLQLDNYASQTTWKIENAEGDALFDSGFYTGMDSQFVSTNVCLDSGCYVLTIYDFGFNGICCNGGQGGFTLLTENGDTISTGGQFGYLDTIQFCVNKTASLIADAQVQNATCGLADGILNVQAIGGMPPYSYSLDNISFVTTNSFQNLSKGSYTVYVKDALDSIYSFNATVLNTGEPIASPSAAQYTYYLNAQDSIHLFSTNSTNAASVLWTLPDGTTRSDRNIKYAYNSDGVYDFILRVDNGTCSDSDTISIVVIDNLSLDQVEDQLSLTIFPNPAQESITVTTPNVQFSQNSTLRLHNSAGKCLKTIRWSGQPNLSIDLNSISAGVYFISVDNGRQILSSEFIKK